MTPRSGAATAEQLGPDGAFAPSGVTYLCVGGRPLLYSRRRQQLYELNPTADFIWRRLAAGEDCGEAAAALGASGVEAAQARAFVDAAVLGWMQGGQLIPRAVQEALAGPPAATRRLALDELAVELSFFGEASADRCDAVFGHLYGERAAGARQIAVVGWAGLFFSVLDGGTRGATAADGLVPQLKGLLTELYAASVDGGFLAHGGFLTRGETALFLSGAPGAGKTTLTTALAASGWAYGGDDIVRIEADGRACGAPFAAAVKSGAWSLTEPYAPEIAGLPTDRRGDGQLVRYWLPPTLAERSPRPIGAVILLARQAGERAVLRPIEPLVALTAILGSAYAERWSLDGQALEALAATLEAARCRRLVYSDIAEAVAAIETLVDV